MLVFATIVLLIVFGGMVASSLGALDVEGANFVVAYLMQTIVIVLPLLLVMQDKKIGIKDLGFCEMSFWKAVRMALAGYFYYLIVMMSVANILWSLNLEVPGFGEQSSYVDFFGDEKFTAMFVVLIITFLAPIIEEIFFRGFVFQTILGRWPRWIAFTVSAAIFAVFHLELQIFIPLFILGLILNFLFFKSKSLYPGIAFHIINNVIALGLEYYLYLHPDAIKMIEGFIRF